MILNQIRDSDEKKISLQNVSVQRALLSVSNKTGLVEFALQLQQCNIEIISTGGTAKYLRDANIPVKDVADVTLFPEMMEGRVKTLHPKIHGGILGKRDSHQEAANSQQIDWIDLVVVNLYPFSETIKNPNCPLEEAIENIDIGGPALIRSAAKNFQWVTVITDPADYPIIVDMLKKDKTVTLEKRQQLAMNAFAYTMQYDAMITHYLQKCWNTHASLRYGENPHQQASAHSLKNENAGILAAKKIQGKALSYNNILDANAALEFVSEFTDPACIIIKHNNACGAAVANNSLNAFQKAYAADSISAFGGVVALNQTCDAATAQAMAKYFFEIIIAPEFESEALKILSVKTNLRLLQLTNLYQRDNLEFKSIRGGYLLQQKDNHDLTSENLKIVTDAKMSFEQIQQSLFAWKIVKHLKSNAIVISAEQQTLGVSSGQVSRIDAVEYALKKANVKLTAHPSLIPNAVMASDGFFPFKDSIEQIAKSGIKTIIQPGGSLRDAEVIAACNAHGIAMAFTHVRSFKH